MALWIAAGQGRPDWDAIFDGFRRDGRLIRAARYYREIAEHYPDAKVLHSERDPDKMVSTSTQATIFSAPEPGPG